MKFRQLSTVVTLLLSSVGCFAASSHPVTFQNDTDDITLSVDYLTGHKYSKCVSYVRPAALTIAPHDAQLSVFRDKNRKSCFGIDKYVSWKVTLNSGVSFVLKYYDLFLGGSYFQVNDGVPIYGTTKIVFGDNRYLLDIQAVDRVVISKA